MIHGEYYFKFCTSKIMSQLLASAPTCKEKSSLLFFQQEKCEQTEKQWLYWTYQRTKIAEHSNTSEPVEADESRESKSRSI